MLSQEHCFFNYSEELLIEHYLIIPIPSNERPGVCLFRIKIPHLFQDAMTPIDVQHINGCHCSSVFLMWLRNKQFCVGQASVPLIKSSGEPMKILPETERILLTFSDTAGSHTPSALAKQRMKLPIATARG